MKKASEERKETAKCGRKKQSVSGQRPQREKEAGEAEKGAGVSNISVSQSPRRKAAISREDCLKDECDFGSIDSSEVEACCHYEYFRESAAMREAFNRNWPMPLMDYRNNDFYEKGG